MRIQTINPYTEDVIDTYSSMVRPDIDEKVENASKAFEAWKETDVKERMKLVRRLGKKMLSGKNGLAEKITEEMGKPLKESVPEVEKCAMVCDYFAHKAKTFLTEEEIKTEHSKSYIRFEPLGVVGSIMPWNFPMWQAIRFVIPSLMVGNVQLLKPSSFTTFSGGIALQQLFDKCKFPESVFQVAVGNSSTGIALTESGINALSFTGSMETGVSVATQAVKDMKKIVLELGGSDPFIVLGDADIDAAVAGAVAGRFTNCGQSCIAAKRIIVVKEVADVFTAKFAEAVKSIKIGDPSRPETELGPLVRDEQRKKLEEQITASVAEGAKIVLGGKRIQRRGFFFEPTIMTGVTNDMTVAKQEVFGPVAPIIVVKNDDEAIQTANDTQYGLGASIWTKDKTKGEKLTRKINAGIICVNKTTRSDPRMPFGGTKKSGFGRELHRFGMLEMVNIKSIIVG